MLFLVQRERTSVRYSGSSRPWLSTSANTGCVLRQRGEAGSVSTFTSASARVLNTTALRSDSLAQIKHNARSRKHATPRCMLLSQGIWYTVLISDSGAHRDMEQARRVLVVDLLENGIGKLNSIDLPAALWRNLRGSVIEVLVIRLQETIVDLV